MGLGSNLLPMHVMWKYREHKSFTLTEEEYILRLDVANMLKCWGALSHICNNLAKSNEQPRIVKAVSIFIDMDSTGGASKRMDLQVVNRPVYKQKVSKLYRHQFILKAFFCDTDLQKQRFVKLSSFPSSLSFIKFSPLVLASM
ncbi:hypothetical protein IGI04_020032 [Brassica rapa subsp. trilocularis]|uniref:Uncharacterized protein n=1 Tax=Brassica rapa subsp. trilocularis TaxID=1813537 RepID=A0ABQ7MJ86_BRACM|nr:hypothetical protein IGI04_020032 [Brassica rapa subsp. trilocularis]